MNFEKRKIDPRPLHEIDPIPEPTSSKPKLKIGIGTYITVFLIIIGALSFGIYKAVSKIDLNVILSIAGDKLEEDGYGNTNFLILGNGGKNHDGSDLTDTMIVASLNKKEKRITMLSIPRDLYIKDEDFGSFKINEIYFHAKKYYKDDASQALELTKTKIEELIGTPIQYWLQIDFNGFKAIVDALGGVDVIVENDIYDPKYPKDGTVLYSPFRIAAGPQHLDGETALKYARSRHTTSDFDRGRRQQQIIYALKEKALQTNILFDGDKINEILDAIKDNMNTNITVKEILTLGSMAEDYKEDQITQRFLHNDPSRCGGYLYQPSISLYKAYVLLPAGGFEALTYYNQLNFRYHGLKPENLNIHILNGTKTAGVAGETKQILRRLCFEVPRFGNSTTKDIIQTTYYYLPKYDENGNILKNSRPKELDFLQLLIPGVESTTPPEEFIQQGYFTESQIVLELGSDYVDSPGYIVDSYYSIPPEPPTPKDKTLTTSSTTEIEKETTEKPETSTTNDITSTDTAPSTDTTEDNNAPTNPTPLTDASTPQ